MALTTSWLIDTSAYVRLGITDEAALWVERIKRGLVRVATVTRLEMGYSAQSGRGLRDEVRQPPLSFMPTEYQTPAMEDRAVEVQLLLADRGQNRSASIPDLLVAATAEIAGLTVLHLDKDFDLIAQVTAQPVERLRLP